MMCRITFHPYRRPLKLDLTSFIFYHYFVHPCFFTIVTYIVLSRFYIYFLLKLQCVMQDVANNRNFVVVRTLTYVV